MRHRAAGGDRFFVPFVPLRATALVLLVQKDSVEGFVEQFLAHFHLLLPPPVAPLQRGVHGPPAFAPLVRSVRAVRPELNGQLGQAVLGPVHANHVGPVHARVNELDVTRKRPRDAGRGPV